MKLLKLVSPCCVSVMKRSKELLHIDTPDSHMLCDSRAYFITLSVGPSIGPSQMLISEQVHRDAGLNKAGYTANTSCGRVGRGGNARFHTFQLDHYRGTNGPTDRRMDNTYKSRERLTE